MTLPGSSPGSALPGLDLLALQPWLEATIGPLAGPLRGATIAGGRSNLTYRVSDGVHEWVLRRPPLGHVLATAHDMGREVTALRALAGSAVPVPAVIASCPDPDVLGAPFYLMQHVDGAVLRAEADLLALADDERRELGEALVDVLADLHTVDIDGAGLADFGRPLGYLERQLRRWAKQLDGSRTRELPDLDRLAGRLAERVPVSKQASVVHGDYRIDNVIVTPVSRGAQPPGGRIAAVLDWEMSTLGDPLADLGTFCMYWDGFSGLGFGGGSPGSLAGFPSREQAVRRYAQRCGVDVEDLAWYVAMAFYKIAVIAEGIYCRYVQGLTIGEGFEAFGERVPTIAERGHATLDDR